LAADGIDLRESHLLGDALLELAYARLVAVEQVEKRGLRAGRAFHAEERELAAAEGNFAIVEEQVVKPERGALADGRQLRGLEVRERELWRAARHPCKLAQFGHEIDDAPR